MNYTELLSFLVQEKELSIVPIIPGEKRPGEYMQGKWRGMMDWERYSSRLPTEIEIEHWSHWPLRSFGLLTGAVSKIIALDFDNRPEIAEEIQKIIPLSPLRKKGAKGYTAFYKFNGEENRKWIVEGETVLELLSDGRQTLIPPSLHPSGNDYVWLDNDFSSFDLDDLEALNKEHLDAIEEIFLSYNSKKQAATNKNFEPTTLAEIGEALNFIRPDNYHDWIKVGMAIASEYPGANGFDLWDRWSSISAKYNQLEMIGKWASFKNVKDVHISSVFFLAQQSGFENKAPKKFKYEVNPIKQIAEAAVAENEATEQPSKVALPQELIDSAPGLVGKITAWINESSIFPQPALALGAALTAVGALKAHRVRTETNLRTNLYVVGVAPSGSGKGKAMERIENLFDAAGLTNLFSGKPVSDSALLKSLRNNKGRRLLQWDELGLALQEMTNTRAASYKTAILSTMMELFSKAGENYHGKEYADHDDKMKRADIDQPCLCVYGASTPSRFFGALSSSYVVDGFASRLIIMETSDPYPKRRKVAISDVPPELISLVQKFEQMPTNSNPRGNLDEVAEIRPKIMKLTEEAASLMDAACDLFDSNRESYSKQSEGFGAVWARSSEHLMKLALVVEDSDKITVESVAWARAVVEHCTKNLCDVILSQVADNEHQRLFNRVLDIIIKAGKRGILRSELYNRTRFLKTYEREDILESLIEAGQVAANEVAGNSKKSVLYVACHPARR